MPDLFTWMLVFIRVSAMLMLFPVFSITNVPVLVRVALGALTAFLIAPMVPALDVSGADLWKIIGLMSLEACYGLLLGFVSKLLFFALDIAGAIIGAEIEESLVVFHGAFKRSCRHRNLRALFVPRRPGGGRS